MDVFIGSIMLWPVPWIPQGWRLCDGSLMSVQENQALFSLIGNRYGGDGRTTFALPDFRNAVVVGSTNPADVGRKIGGAAVPAEHAEAAGAGQAPGAASAAAPVYITQNWIIATQGFYPPRE